MLEFSDELSYQNAGDVVEKIRATLPNTQDELVLDLSSVTSLDSSGLRALVQGQKLCKEAGVGFRIGSISECAARVINIGGFSEVFGLSRIETDICRDTTSPIPGVDAKKCNTYEYSVVSEASMISVLRARACDAAEEAGASGEELCDVQIAVGEALTNAYRHGSPQKGISKITMSCTTCPGALRVEIEDEGYPFDPDATTEPDPKLLRDHGMGIYLMRQAMDEVEFHIGNPGNRVVMVKRFCSTRDDL